MPCELLSQTAVDEMDALRMNMYEKNQTFKLYFSSSINTQKKVHEEFAINNIPQPLQTGSEGIQA